MPPQTDECSRITERSRVKMQRFSQPVRSLATSGCFSTPTERDHDDDLRRVTDKPGERSNFFGFQTSKKSFLTNLAAVVAICLWRIGKALAWIIHERTVSVAPTAGNGL